MLGILAHYVLSLAFVILVCLLFSYCFKKSTARFEQVLPVALMSTSLLMFFLTLIFHNIQLAFVVTIAGYAIALATFVYFDNQRKQTIVHFLKSPAVGVFVVLLAALFVVNYGRILTGFDDLIHWGPFVVDSLRLNDFYNASSNMAFSVHGDYPPAAAMFEVFYLKLTENVEWLMFVAMQLLCLSMLFPLLSRFTWQKKSRSVSVFNVLIIAGLVLAALLSVSLQAEAAFFYEIRIDTLLACAGAYGVFIAFTEGKRFLLSTVIKLSILITFLLLLKQVALVMVVVVVSIYMAMLYAHRKKSKFFKKPLFSLKNVSKRTVAVVIVAFLLPVVSLKLWDTQVSGCLNASTCTVQFTMEAKNFLKVPLVLLERSGTELQQETASHFLRYVYSGDTLLNFNGYKVTYVQFIVLFCIVMIFLGVYARKKRQGVKDIAIVAGVMIIGYFGYLYLLLGTYLYSGFSAGEMQILASADRYIGTYILMMILVAVIVFIELWSRSYKLNKHLFIPGLIVLGVFVLILNPTAYKSILPYQFLGYSKMYTIDEFKKPIDEVVSTIKSDKDFNKNSVVVLAECDQQHALWESNYLRYEIRPNPYMVLISRPTEDFVRNIDYKPSYQYIDPAGRDNTNSKEDVAVFVVAMCSGDELEEYNTQPANRIDFDTVEGIKEKWQVFKTSAEGNYYNTLNEKLVDLKPL